MACSYDGVYYSKDGKTWSVSSEIQYIHCYNAEYDADHNIWCVSTYNHGVAYSTDGITWTYNAPGTASNYFTHIIYRNKMWVGMTYSDGLYFSKDGVNWSQSNLTKSSITADIVYGNKKWIAPLKISQGGGRYDYKTYVACYH